MYAHVGLTLSPDLDDHWTQATCNDSGDGAVVLYRGTINGIMQVRHVGIAHGGYVVDMNCPHQTEPPDVRQHVIAEDYSPEDRPEVYQRSTTELYSLGD